MTYYRHFDATIYSRPTVKGSAKDFRIGITFKPTPSMTVKELVELSDDLKQLIEEIRKS